MAKIPVLQKLTHMSKPAEYQCGYIQYLRYKLGFGGEFEGAGDFFSNLILKLSDAFLDLIDLEVFFGSCSSATYTRRRSRIAKPEVDKIRA